MIVVTTQMIEGKKVKEYKGLVFGEVVCGIEISKDIMGSFVNITGGRSEEYEGELINARNAAINEMINRANDIGANAIIGVKVDLENFKEGHMLMVNVSGTAVIIE